MTKGAIVKKTVGLISLIALLFSGVVFANPKNPNVVGLYLNDVGTGASETNEIGTLVDVFLVLSNPSDEEHHDVPCSSVNLFQLSLSFNPVPHNDLFLMSSFRPPGSVDGGQRKDINEGFIDFDVGFGPDPLVVTKKTVVLIKLTFMNMSATLTEVFLVPVPRAYIPGEIVFYSGLDYYQVMHPVGELSGVPAFVFNGGEVAVENESFGSVKALYR